MKREEYWRDCEYWKLNMEEIKFGLDGGGDKVESYRGVIRHRGLCFEGESRDSRDLLKNHCLSVF